MKNNSPYYLFFMLTIFTFFLLLSSQATLNSNFNSSLEVANSTTDSNCKSIVTKSNTSIKSVRHLLIKRGNYSYSIRFATKDKYIFAYLSSENGVTLKKGDELILMDANRERRRFTFAFNQSLSSPSDISLNEQWMEMEPEDLIWLASQNIPTVYIKDNQANRMIKFSVSPAHQETLKKIAFCFLKEMKD